MNKLSDYMRIGAQKRGQAFETYFDDIGETSCALGAAYEGKTGFNNYYNGPNIENIFPFIFDDNLVPVCPECQEEIADLFHYITHLNDDHKWTRAAIADNLEGLGL